MLLYFDWPKKEQAERWFKALGVPSPDQVAQDVFHYAKTNSVRFTSGSLISGAMRALKMQEDFPRARILDPARLSSVIIHLCSPTPELKAKEYELGIHDYLPENSVGLSSAAARRSRQ